MLCRCLQIHAADNVATLLDEAAEGAELAVLGESALKTVEAAQPIPSGHKVALRPIAPGEAVVKYGCAIGEASSPIAPGEWIHLHNCRSFYDARTSELDLDSGVPRETRYA
jgi:hypothetical protein